MQDLQASYRILRVSPNATQTEIKRAFRLLSRQYHPDFNPGNPEAAAEFRRICEAYKTLSNPLQETFLDAESWNHNKSASANSDNAIIPEFQKSYIQGVNLATREDYAMAIEAFTRSIALNPKYLDAYLGRCQIRVGMGDDRGVLEDCRHILSLAPNTLQALYFQGRAHQRLGVSLAAIEDYTRAIALAADHGKAYYFRGLARLDLREHHLGIQDLQVAAKLFRQEKNIEAYRRVNETLAELHRLNGSAVEEILPFKRLGWIALHGLPKVCCNPGVELQATYSLLTPHQAALTGFLFMVVALIGAALSSLGQSILGLSLSGGMLALLGGVLFLSLWGSSFLVRLAFGRSQNGSADIFLAGAALLPISIGLLLGSGLGHLGPFAWVGSGLLAGTFLIVSLYSGLTQLHHCSEQCAVVSVPVMLSLASAMVAIALKIWPS
ncbi:MAG: DnaJ domain-containing protein [Thermosynechococcaceae cyanobacterium]